MTNSRGIYCNIWRIIKQIASHYDLGQIERSNPSEFEALVKSTLAIMIFHELGHFILREL